MVGDSDIAYSELVTQWMDITLDLSPTTAKL